MGRHTLQELIFHCTISLKKTSLLLVNAALLSRRKCRWLTCARHTRACSDLISGVRFVFLPCGSEERLNTAVMCLQESAEQDGLSQCVWGYTVAALVPARKPACGTGFCIRIVWVRIRLSIKALRVKRRTFKEPYNRAFLFQRFLFEETAQHSYLHKC